MLSPLFLDFISMLFDNEPVEAVEEASPEAPAEEAAEEASLPKEPETTE